jgi:hypothetical protein
MMIISSASALICLLGKRPLRCGYFGWHTITESAGKIMKISQPSAGKTETK